jgi:anti-sigma B factor antagonist
VTDSRPFPGQQVEVLVDRANGVYVVRLRGAIDASSVEIVKRELSRITSLPQPRVVVDCSDLYYVNSTGFGMFFAWHRACENNRGRLALCCVQEKVRKIMGLLGLEGFVTVCGTRAEATARVGK